MFEYQLMPILTLFSDYYYHVAVTITSSRKFIIYSRVAIAICGLFVIVTFYLFTGLDSKAMELINSVLSELII